jgi:hypothetical protein
MHERVYRTGTANIARLPADLNGMQEGMLAATFLQICEPQTGEYFWRRLRKNLGFVTKKALTWIRKADTIMRPFPPGRSLGTNWGL